MKTFLILISIIFISTCSFSQTKKPGITYDAGIELRKASKYYYLGLASEIAGASLLYLGIYHYKDSPDLTEEKAKRYKFARTDCYIFGGTLLFVGVASQFSAFYHIGRAGKKLTMQPSSDGLTLSLKL